MGMSPISHSHYLVPGLCNRSWLAVASYAPRCRWAWCTAGAGLVEFVSLCAAITADLVSTRYWEGIVFGLGGLWKHPFFISILRV